MRLAGSSRLAFTALAVVVAACSGNTAPPASDVTTTGVTTTSPENEADSADADLDTYDRLAALEAEFGAGSPEAVTALLATNLGPLPTTEGFPRDRSTYPTFTHMLEEYSEIRDQLDPSDVEIADERIAELFGPEGLIVAFDLDGEPVEPQGLRRSPVDEDAIEALEVDDEDDPDDDFIDGDNQRRWTTLGNSVWADLAPHLPSITIDAVVVITEPSFWVGRGDDDDPDSEPGGGNVTRSHIARDPSLRPLRERYGNHDCYILIASDRDEIGTLTTAVLAHELFHCWHYTYLGNDYRRYRNAPEWVLEGLAGWVGETQSGGTNYSDAWYPRFAVPVFDLFAADYPAIGFWQRVHEGADLWASIPRIVTAAANSSNADAFETAIGTIDSRSAYVASGIIQRPDLGDEWTMSGGVASGVSRAPESIDVDPSNPARRSVAPGAQAGYELTVSPGAGADGSIVTVAASGYLAGEWQDDQAFAAFDESIDLDYCIGDCDDCPGGGPTDPGRPLPSRGATLIVALAGTASESGELSVSVVDCEPDDDGPTASPEGSDRDPGRGGSYGHPNLVTFDGVSYVFHGAGDYTLAESTEDDFAVHARFSRLNNMTGVSFNRAVAAQVGATVVSFGDDDESTAFDPLTVRIDGEIVDPDAGDIDIDGLATLSTAGELFVLSWVDGAVLRVGRRVGDQFDLYVPSTRWGSVVGLLGNANSNREGDVADRSGAPADPGDFDEFYARFGADWLIDPIDSMFDTPLDAIDDQPIVPTAQITLADLDDEVRTDAEAVCAAAGIEPGSGLAQCTFDVAMTGDSRWTTGVLAMRETVDQSVAAASVTARSVEDTEVLDAVGSIRGELRGRLVSDEFLVSLRSGDAVEVNVANCPNNSTFEVALFAPSGRLEARTEGDDCGSFKIRRLFESGEYTLAVSDSGGFTGAYEFDIALPGDDAATGTEIGDVAEFLITDDDPSPSVSFEGDAGQTLRFDRLDDINIGFTTLVLLGPDGAEVERWPAAEDFEFKLRVGGTHTLTLDVIAGVSPGPAEVSIEAIGSTAPQTVTIGTEFVMDVETPDEVALATFVVAAGSPLMIASDVNDDFIEAASAFLLLDPDGALVERWFAFKTGDAVASTTGEYTLVFQPGNGLTGNVSVIISSS